MIRKFLFLLLAVLFLFGCSGEHEITSDYSFDKDIDINIYEIFFLKAG